MPSRTPLLLLCALLLVTSAAWSQTGPVTLTETEKQWIRDHPTVRFGVDPAWPPFSFVGKDGKHHGIDTEILELIASRVGLRFELVGARSWAETELHAIQHQVEFVPGTAETAERAKHLLFTKPYLSAPVAVIMREDAPFWVGMHALIGRIVASPRKHVTTHFLETHHPDIQILPTDSVAESLERVAHHKSDATLANLIVASHLIKTRGLQNLKIVGLIDERFDLRLAVRNDQPELLAILNKALDSVSEREHAAILERWISLNIEDAINWALIRRLGTWVLLVGGGIIGAGLVWNRRLARELVARRKVEAALRENETQLSTANADLKMLNEHRRMLMGMVAHDLKNPLTALTVGCDLLDEQIPAANVPARSEVASIREAVDRMQALTSNLLSAEAIEQGARQFATEPLVVAALVSPIIERLKCVAEAKAIALSYEAGDAAAQITGDASAFGQIAENLIGNALKFTPRGGKVEVSFESAADKLRLIVTDSGPGVSAEDQPRLFGKFARLSAQPTAGESSTGLGLAIVKLLVTRMAGTIHYEDAPGGGARFIAQFPRLPSR